MQQEKERIAGIRARGEDQLWLSHLNLRQVEQSTNSTRLAPITWIKIDGVKLVLIFRLASLLRHRQRVPGRLELLNYTQYVAIASVRQGELFMSCAHAVPWLQQLTFAVRARSTVVTVPVRDEMWHIACRVGRCRRGLTRLVVFFCFSFVRTKGPVRVLPRP